ncbi:MAG: hypothetical protein ACTSV2_05515 [Candidatus Thorarchaeota archaeon]
MKFEIKHAMTLVIIGFLAIAPIMAAAGSDSFVTAQDDVDLENLIGSIMADGAEIIYANINEEGEPGVIYGQLGIPSADLGLDEPMFDNCIALALVGTHGEFIEMVMDMIGLDLAGTNTSTAQFGDEGMDFDSIFDMIGTEFNLLITVYLDNPEASSASQMGSVLAHLGDEFGFAFTGLFNIRIDDAMFPPEADIELPFESLDVFIHTEESAFADAVDSMFSVMDGTGFLAEIDKTVFSESEAAAAGLIAIPDMAAVMEMLEGFMGGSEPDPFATSALFQVAQFPMEALTGPIAIAAVGYLGEQVLSTTSTELSIGDLVGATGALDPISTGQALVIGQMPSTINITSFTPDTEGAAFLENETNMVIWNSTVLGSQADYVIYFDEGDFPPMITIDRTFSPESTIAGGSTIVTVTITNDGDDPITNLELDDSGIAAIYSSITVTGDTAETFTTLAAGASETMVYTVVFPNEGGYTFPKAVLEYDFDGDSFTKDTTKDGYLVAEDLVGFLGQFVLDGMPYTGAALGLIALVGIYSIRGILKGKSEGSTFQV